MGNLQSSALTCPLRQRLQPENARLGKTPLQPCPELAEVNGFCGYQ